MVKERDSTDLIHEDVQESQNRKPWRRYLEAELGLRDHWYPAIFSHELKEGETKAETIAGERLYFKRVDGNVYCMEDRCAHRGVQFSRHPEVYSKNTITCWFHGFCYDVRNGKLVSVLSDPDSGMVGKVSIKTYPVFEKHSLIFVFIGDMDPPPPIEEDVQPIFWNPNLYVRPLTRNKLRCNWRLAAENGIDQGHLYLHRNWAFAERYGVQLPLGNAVKSKDEVVVLDEPGGPKGLNGKSTIVNWVGEVEGVKVAARTVDPDDPPPADRYLSPRGVGCYLPCGLEVPDFPREDLYHIEWYVPIDEDHHYYTIIQGTVAETEEDRRIFDREVDEYLAKEIWNDDPEADPLGEGPNPGGFNNADAFGRDGIEHAYANENWWYRERLHKPDYTIIQWRMLVHRYARGIQKRGNFARLNEE